MSITQRDASAGDDAGAYQSSYGEPSRERALKEPLRPPDTYSVSKTLVATDDAARAAGCADVNSKIDSVEGRDILPSTNEGGRVQLEEEEREGETLVYAT